jgi:hypothetical protein
MSDINAATVSRLLTVLITYVSLIWALHYF